MSALWRKCKRCRRVYRGRNTGSQKLRCWYCPSKIKLQGVRREIAEPLEAAWLIGGIVAAQEVATPDFGNRYRDGFGGEQP